MKPDGRSNRAQIASRKTHAHGSIFGVRNERSRSIDGGVLRLSTWVSIRGA
jgi:hypothetical protein